MLTEVAIRQAKAKEKPYRLSDQGGLYLEVSPICHLQVNCFYC